MSNIEPEPEKNKRREDENDNIEESQPDKKKQKLEKSDEDEDIIKCEDCSKTFARNFTYYRHYILKHTGINKSFDCNECSKKFTRFEYLWNHTCFPKCSYCAMELRTKKERLRHVCKPRENSLRKIHGRGFSV